MCNILVPYEYPVNYGFAPITCANLSQQLLLPQDLFMSDT